MTLSPPKRLFLPWSDRFSVGVESLDEDHRDLVDLINRACAAWVDGRRDELRREVQKLLALAAEHFEREEEILRSVPSYRSLKAHAGEHRNRLAQLQRIVDAISDDGADFDGVRIADALVDWFVKQSVGHDAAIKAYFDDGAPKYARR